LLSTTRQWIMTDALFKGTRLRAQGQEKAAFRYLL